MLTFLSLAQRKKPRWIVWENVPGVLSSNGGRDFATFLTALGDIGYGFAYRVLDAQYFGVAQRRRRVFVVGYLGDWRPCASVLFECESLSGDSKKSREKRKTTSSDAQGCSGGGGKSGIATFAGNIESNVAATLQTSCDDYSRADGFNVVAHAFKVRGGSEVETGEQGGTPGKKAGKGYLGQDEKVFTIGTTQDQQIAQPIAYENRPSDARVKPMGETCQTLTSRLGTGGGNLPLVQQPIPFRKTKRATSQDDHETWVNDEVANTLNTFDLTGDIRTTNAVAQPLAVDCYNQTVNEHTTQTIGSSASDVNHYGAVLQPMSVDFRNQNLSEDVTGTIQSKSNGGYSLNYQPGVLQPNISPTITQCKGSRGGSSMEALDEVSAIYAQQPTMAIRRLTPRECERLQGFPDDWTLIPYRNKSADQCPDGPRYKACGNSMAVPVMRWIGERIEMVEQLMK